PTRPWPVNAVIIPRQLHHAKGHDRSLRPVQAEKDNNNVCYELVPFKVPERGHINVRSEFEF
ncbi:MAG: hypothetical protein WA648_06970, partial [Methylocella sp.]